MDGRVSGQSSQGHGVCVCGDCIQLTAFRLHRSVGLRVALLLLPASAVPRCTDTTQRPSQLQSSMPPLRDSLRIRATKSRTGGRSAKTSRSRSRCASKALGGNCTAPASSTTVAAAALSCSRPALPVSSLLELSVVSWSKERERGREREMSRVVTH